MKAKLCSDPYAILGLPKGASENAVRVAYRRLAAQYHPDRNPGDVQAEARYKDVVRAYEALTGRGAVDNADNESAGILAQVLQQVVVQLAQEGRTPKDADVLARMQNAFDRSLAELKKQLKEQDKFEERLREAGKRFEGGPLMTSLCDGCMHGLDEVRQRIAREVARQERALEMLKGYKYRVDKGKSTSTSSTIAGYVVFNVS